MNNSKKLIVYLFVFAFVFLFASVNTSAYAQSDDIDLTRELDEATDLIKSTDPEPEPDSDPDPDLDAITDDTESAKANSTGSGGADLVGEPGGVDGTVDEKAVADDAAVNGEEDGAVLTEDSDSNGEEDANLAETLDEEEDLSGIETYGLEGLDISKEEDTTTITLTEDVIIDTGAAGQTIVPMVVEAGKTLTFDLNGFRLTSRLEDNSKSLFVVEEGGTLNIINSGSLNYIYADTKDRKGRAVLCEKGSTVIIDNVWFWGFETTGNGGAIAAKDANLTVRNAEFSYNVSYGGNEYGGGGAIHLDGSETISTIENCTFTGNKCGKALGDEKNGSGGAIYLERGTKITIRNNTIKESSTRRHGGAIYARIPGNVEIIGNEITNNNADSRSGHGGGIAVIAGGGYTATLTNNTITNNTANRGGGLHLIDSKEGGIKLQGGTISGNEAGTSGGGIDYTIHDQDTLYLENVLITDNKSVRGGGVWACPISEVETYSTLGGAIFGNISEGEKGGLYPITAAGDDVRYEGADTDDKFALINNPVSESSSSFMTITQRALGGGLMEWYSDEPGDKYRDGDSLADPGSYTKTDKSFGLHGVLAEDYQTLARDAAELIIKDNTAGRWGGGIATNSPVVIGLRDADITVNVEKVWQTEEDSDLPVAQLVATESGIPVIPKSVFVDLIRIDAQGNRVTLDRGVELNVENEWKASFTDLPSKYSGGKYTYDIVEQPIDGWQSSSSVDVSQDGLTYSITLTNTPGKELADLQIKKVVSRGDRNRAWEFTVEIDGELYSGTYTVGEDERETEDGKITIKHNETAVISDLDVGTEYSVVETPYGRYRISSTNEEGTIDEDGVLVTFTNYLRSSGGGGGGGTTTPSDPGDDEVIIDEDDIPLDLPDMLDMENHFRYIAGYPDNTVQPEGNVTREEVAAVFFRLLTSEYRDTIRTRSHKFPDVEAGRWSEKPVATLAKGKIIRGYEDGNFRPGNNITRAELAVIASRFDNLTPFTSDKFSDIQGHWANKQINSASEKGWVNGYEDGTFKPDQYITRAEFMTLVNNVLNRHVKRKNVLEDARQFPDLSKDAWYYTAVQEAINSHHYERADGEKYETWTEIYYPVVEM